jgi:hypothetical protein
MKKLILISIMVFMAASSLGYSQTKNNSNRSLASGNSKPGLINITELNAGIGLYAQNRDYAKNFTNLTSIFGIGLTKNFTGGIGVGVSLYNGGTMVPLFADFRYFFNVGKTRLFAFGDGGILLNSATTEGGIKILVSPGVGCALPVNKSLSINLGAALLTQFWTEEYAHDSFVYIKLGMTYSFKKN